MLAGLVTVLLGLTVLLGWHTQNALLVQILPELVPMQYNTALAFLGVGTASAALCLARRSISVVLGLAIALLGSLTLLQYLLGVDFGIDELLMRHYIQVETSHPGRMAPNTALCFLLTGIAIALLASHAGKKYRAIVAQILALLVTAMSTTALLGYVLGSEDAYGWGALTRMAPHTALGFIGISVGLLAYSSTALVEQVSTVPLWVPGGLYVAVLVIDLQTPAGFAAGVAYVPLVFCCLWFARPYVAYVCAIFSTALIALGYVASHSSAEVSEIAVVNRGLSLLAVWVTAVIVFLYMSTSARLTAKNDQLELALEGGALGLWDWKVTSGKVRYSSQWYQITGYAPDEVDSEPSAFERLVHPDDLLDARKQFNRYLSGEEPEYRSDFRIRHKSGEWRWVHARGKVVATDTNGSASRVLGFHVDITDRKLAEERLRLLQKAIDHSDSVVLITTPNPEDPRIVYASQRSVTVCGYEPAELIGRNPSFLQAGASEQDQLVLSQLRSALLNGGLFEGVLTNVRKDGEEYRIRLHIFPIKDASGQLLNFGSIGYDVTKEHEVQVALQQEQEQFRSIFAYSPIGVALVSTGGHFLRVNQSLCDIVGYSEAELLARDFQQITHPDDLEEDLDYLQQMLDGSITSYEIEKRYFHKHGHTVWILLTVSLVWNADGTPRHFVSQIQDISARKANEQTISEHLSELERSNQELDDFAYIASHDLKEPLRGINNHSQSLLKRYSDQLDEKGVHKLNRLNRLTSKMEQLISDLLYFSRIGRGGSSLELKDLNQLVDEQIDTLSTFLKERNAQVTVTSALPMILCDAPKLATVFRNLIANAVKYNDSEQKTVSIWFNETTEHEGETLQNVFHIADNGIGIEPEFHDSVFRMFKRLHGEKVYGEGTGAGLTFVKKIIEQQGGRIWLTSEPGRGTRFSFTIPGEIHEKA